MARAVASALPTTSATTSTRRTSNAHRMAARGSMPTPSYSTAIAASVEGGLIVVLYRGHFACVGVHMSHHHDSSLSLERPSPAWPRLWSLQLQSPIRLCQS